MKYILKLSEKQAEIIKIALEEYFRLRLNQWSDFAIDVSYAGYKYDKNDPDNNRKFDDYINRWNESRELFEKAFRIGQPEYHMKTDEMMIAEDIWQVIRHKLWIDRHGEEDSWCVDVRKPMSMTGEPLPKMERMGDEIQRT